MVLTLSVYVVDALLSSCAGEATARALSSNGASLVKVYMTGQTKSMFGQAKDRMIVVKELIAELYLNAGR